MKKILVTGSVGFIGSELALRLLSNDIEVIGIDNHNPYYNPALKERRLERFIGNKNYKHYRIDLKDIKSLKEVFLDNEFSIVVNLAAQAGVRYSFENPASYIDSNVVGFGNLLECSRQSKIDHLIYASSSSVYGLNKKLPFSVKDRVDHPINLYAASKKTNELMAHAYSHIYKLKTTGLRFFSVYGPWGRPDMALWLFTEKINRGEKIQVFNKGDHKRDFTYIDDIVEGLLSVVLDRKASSAFTGLDNKNDALYRIYNIGNNKSVPLNDFITEIEKNLQKKSIKEFLPLQMGDVAETWADIDSFKDDFNYNPKTSVKEGVKKFVQWYLEYIE